jgi:hypothetical protein
VREAALISAVAALGRQKVPAHASLQFLLFVRGESRVTDCVVRLADNACSPDKPDNLALLEVALALGPLQLRLL